MKKMVIATVVALSCFIANVFASGTGVIDMQAIFHGAPQVKQLNDKLQKKFSPRKQKLQDLSTKLQKEVADLNKNEAVLSADKKSQLQADIAAQSKDLRQKQMQFQQDLFVAQNKATTQFMKEVQSVVASIAKARQLTLVIPKNGVLYSVDSMDITALVLKKIK